METPNPPMDGHAKKIIPSQIPRPAKGSIGISYSMDDADQAKSPQLH